MQRQYHTSKKTLKPRIVCKHLNYTVFKIHRQYLQPW